MAVPAAPEAFVSKSGDHLSVQWLPDEDDVTYGDTTDELDSYVSNVTSWEVERSPDGSTGWTQVRDEADENILSYDDAAANTANTEYFYRVRGVNGEGNGSYSTVVSETTEQAPTAPSAIAAAKLYEDLNVTWTLNSTNEYQVELERSTDGAAYSALVTLPAGSAQYRDESVALNTAYWYRVRTTNAVGSTAYSTVSGSTTTVTALPAAPTGVSCASISTGVRVSWTANEATNISSYEIQRSTDTGQTWSSLESGVTAPATSYDDTTATQGTQYMYRVIVEWTETDSHPSNPAFAIGGGASLVDNYRPNAPRVFRAVGTSETQLTCSWLDCSEVETGYRLEYKRNGDPVSAYQNIVLGASTQTRVIGGLTANTTYNLRVRANGANSINSDWVYANGTTNQGGGGTIPSAPSNFQLQVSPPRSSDLLCTWTDNANNELGFVVEFGRLDEPTILNYHWITTPNTTSYRVSRDPPTQGNLIGGRVYFGRVLAYNEDANGNIQFSDFSNYDTATAYSGPTVINPPTNLRDTEITENTVTMEWDDANNGLAEAHFIDRSFDGTNWFSRHATVSGTATKYTDGGLPPDTNVWYRVRAYMDALGPSDPSNELAVRTLPGRPRVPEAPTGVNASEVNAATARVVWTYPSQQTTHEGFRVYRSLTSGSGYAQVGSDIEEPTQRSYLDTGISAATLYYYIVRAYNTAGESADSNEDSLQTTAPLGAPTAPSDPAAVLLNGNIIRISWSDNSSDETGFKVKRSTSQGGPYTTIDNGGGLTVGPNITSYDDTELATSTTYYYVIAATNSSGDSSDTTEVSATTGSEGAAAPGAPEVTLSVTGTRSITVNWISDGGRENYFDVLRDATSPPTTKIGDALSRNTFTYPDSGLTPNTTYFYRVNAVNAAGTGSSDVVSGTTLRATGPGRGVGERVFTFSRNFDKDDSTITLFNIPMDAIIVGFYFFTEDAATGPFCTLKAGANAIGQFALYDGYVASKGIHKVEADTAVTIEFSGTGTGIGGYVITVYVP